MRNEPIEKFNVDGLTVKILVDEDPTSPRENDNAAVFVCHHKRYRLGDEHGFGPSSLYDTAEDLKAAIVEKEKPALILPLYLFDHSGISISLGDFGDRWDSGLIGFAYVTWERAREIHSAAVTIKQIREMVKAEVAEYDDFLRGNVYGYIVEDAEGEEIDSCWGFICDTKYVVEEATATAKACAESIAADKAARGKEPMQSWTVTLSFRSHEGADAVRAALAELHDKLDKLGAKARAAASGIMRCPACDDPGPHDNNGGRVMDLTLCCRVCGEHFDVFPEAT